MKCYVCGDEITNANESFEHIILNAAGGRLRSKGLICKKCNNEFGEGIDSALAKQLNHLANMLMIERHHGEPQPIIGRGVSSGTEYQLEVGGRPSLTKPVFSKSKEGNITSFSIRARSQEELRRMIKGMARKNSGLAVEDAINAAKWITKKLNEKVAVSVEIGGEIEFRAVCKCAVNFFIHKGGDVAEISHLVPYIKGEVKLNVVWMHYQQGLYELQPGESFHILHVVGNFNDRTLYCYVDYFNAHKFLVLLSDNYQGPDIRSTYCFDVLQIKEVQRQVNIHYDRKTLINFFENRDRDPYKKVTDALDHSLRIGFKRQLEFQREQLFMAAVQKVLGRYPAGSELTEVQTNEVLNEVINVVLPNLLEELNIKS